VIDFLQKHEGSYVVPIKESNPKKKRYYTIKDKDGWIFFGEVGRIERNVVTQLVLKDKIVRFEKDDTEDSAVYVLKDSFLFFMLQPREAKLVHIGNGNYCISPTSECELRLQYNLQQARKHLNKKAS
jgi:hypothetical protein